MIVQLACNFEQEAASEQSIALSNSPLTLPSTHSVVNGLTSEPDTVTMYYVFVWV